MLGHLVLALIDVAVGLVAVVWSAPTALVLTLIIAIWAIVAGVFESIAAFPRGESAGTRPMFIVTGLLSIAFGAIVVNRPAAGAYYRAAVRTVQHRWRRHRDHAGR